MDHGSHTFYLAFDWLGAYPTAITAQDVDARAPFDTEDNFSCSLHLPDRDGVARTSRGTPACARCIYTIHGERGAIRVEDDDVEIAVEDAATRTAATAWEIERRGDRLGLDGREPRHLVQLAVRASSRRPSRAGDFVGQGGARARFLCVQLITTAYASARDGSRELPLPGWPRWRATTSRPDLAKDASRV